MQLTKSAVAENFRKTGDEIDFENVKFLARLDGFFQWKIREAIEIFKCPNNFNRDKGYPLSSTWIRFLKSSVCAGHLNNSSNLLSGTVQSVNDE